MLLEIGVNKYGFSLRYLFDSYTIYYNKNILL